VPDTYSGHSLIPHLNVLQNLYLSRLDKSERDAYEVLYFNLEFLPYTLGAAWYALAELGRLQCELSAEVSDEAFTNAHVIGLSSDARDRMAFEVDAFLEAARRSQNAVLFYLSHGLKKSFSGSLYKFVKKLEQHETFGLPEKLRANILKYWEDHGRRLRDYRNRSQHTAYITSDARLFRDPEGRRAIHFVLPSNPEEESPARLRFGDPPIHAFTYLLNEFYALVCITHWITAGLVPSGLTARMAVRVFRGGLSLDLSGNPVPNADTVAKEVARLQAALNKAAT